MEGLMHFCRNWGDTDCHPDVGDLKYPKEVKGRKEIPTWPVGEELKKLDDICMKCDSRFLINEEEKCPICDSEDVERTGGSHYVPGWATAYGYRCNDCKEKFWIHESSLKK